FFPPFQSTAPAPTSLYALSLHDALPIFPPRLRPRRAHRQPRRPPRGLAAPRRLARRARPLLPRLTHAPPIAKIARLYRFRTQQQDRKSTRLNSSHVKISYAVFCLKKKKK